jgi:hypothetical protein
MMREDRQKLEWDQLRRKGAHEKISHNCSRICASVDSNDLKLNGYCSVTLLILIFASLKSNAIRSSLQVTVNNNSCLDMVC